MTDKLSDPAAEFGVVSGVFRHGADAFFDVADVVNPDAFFVDTNQVCWKVYEHLFAEDKNVRVDLPTFLSAAKRLGYDDYFAKSTEQSYLKSLTNAETELPSVRRLAGNVAKLNIARLYHHALGKSRASLEEVQGHEPIEHILGLVERPIFDLTSALHGVQNDGPVRIGSGLKDYVQHLIDNPREMEGISTGFPRWDASIGGGLRSKTVNVVGARPKTGKSQMAMRVALHVASKQKLPVLYLDTEMSQEDQQKRAVSFKSGVPVNAIGRGKLDAEQRLKVFRAVEQLEAIPYEWQSCAGRPFEETLAVMRRWVMRNVGLDSNGLAKPCVVVFDYLKLMSAEGLGNHMAEFQAMGFIMTALHNFMVRYGVACLAFVQLNRDGITVEDTDAVSQSDRIVWLCSNLSILKWKTPEEMAENPRHPKYTHKLIPIVCRHGEGLPFREYIHVETDFSCSRMEEGETSMELRRGGGGAGFAGEVAGEAGEVPFNNNEGANHEPGQRPAPAPQRRRRRQAG